INYCKIKSDVIVCCYGITRFPEKEDYATEAGNYVMVMNYFPHGSLRNYLKINHLKLDLKDRIKIFYFLCTDILIINSKYFIHCVLQSYNILISTLNICIIADLGLSGLIDNKLSNNICGIIPYIAPEVLEGNKKTKESDIYSIGML